MSATIEAARKAAQAQANAAVAERVRQLRESGGGKLVRTQSRTDTHTHTDAHARTPAGKGAAAAAEKTLSTAAGKRRKSGSSDLDDASTKAPVTPGHRAARGGVAVGHPAVGGRVTGAVPGAAPAAAAGGRGLGAIIKAAAHAAAKGGARGFSLAESERELAEHDEAVEATRMAEAKKRARAAPAARRAVPVHNPAQAEEEESEEESYEEEPMEEDETDAASETNSHNQIDELDEDATDDDVVTFRPHPHARAHPGREPTFAEGRRIRRGSKANLEIPRATTSTVSALLTLPPERPTLARRVRNRLGRALLFALGLMLAGIAWSLAASRGTSKAVAAPHADKDAVSFVRESMSYVADVSAEHAHMLQALFALGLLLSLLHDAV